MEPYEIIRGVFIGLLLVLGVLTLIIVGKINKLRTKMYNDKPIEDPNKKETAPC